LGFRDGLSLLSNVFLEDCHNVLAIELFRCFDIGDDFRKGIISFKKGYTDVTKERFLVLFVFRAEIIHIDVFDLFFFVGEGMKLASHFGIRNRLFLY
jgi:hypothetical protein